MYDIDFTDDAKKQLADLYKHAPKAIAKLQSLLDEIAANPRSGTGKPERLKHHAEETWSRRINREHRLVYRVYDDRVLVLVLSVFGHY